MLTDNYTADKAIQAVAATIARERIELRETRKHEAARLLVSGAIAVTEVHQPVRCAPPPSPPPPPTPHPHPHPRAQRHESNLVGPRLARTMTCGALLLGLNPDTATHVEDEDVYGDAAAAMPGLQLSAVQQAMQLSARAGGGTGRAESREGGRGDGEWHVRRSHQDASARVARRMVPSKIISCIKTIQQRFRVSQNKSVKWDCALTAYDVLVFRAVRDDSTELTGSAAAVRREGQNLLLGLNRNVSVASQVFAATQGVIDVRERVAERALQDMARHRNAPDPARRASVSSAAAGGAAAGRAFTPGAASQRSRGSLASLGLPGAAGGRPPGSRGSSRGVPDRPFSALSRRPGSSGGGAPGAAGRMGGPADVADLLRRQTPSGRRPVSTFEAAEDGGGGGSGGLFADMEALLHREEEAEAAVVAAEGARGGGSAHSRRRPGSAVAAATLRASAPASAWLQQRRESGGGVDFNAPASTAEWFLHPPPPPSPAAAARRHETPHGPHHPPSHSPAPTKASAEEEGGASAAFAAPLLAGSASADALQQVSLRKGGGLGPLPRSHSKPLLRRVHPASLQAPGQLLPLGGPADHALPSMNAAAWQLGGGGGQGSPGGLGAGSGSGWPPAGSWRT